MARAMKDSGIAWIGQIPEEWGVVALKYLCTMQAGKNLVSEQITEEGLYPVYGGNGQRGFFCEYNCEGEKLVVGRQGALCGNVHKVAGRIWATEHAIITNATSLISQNYLYYLLIGMNLKQYVSSTAAQPGLAVSTIQNVRTCLPTLEEQERIARFLDAKCSRIDVVIKQTRASIEEYKKLKQAVITQAVTKGIRPNRPMKDSGIDWIGEIRSDYQVYRMKHLIAEPLMYGANESGIPYEENLPRYIRITDISLDGKIKDTGKLSLTEEAAEDYILVDDDVLFARSGATVGKAFIYKEKYGRAAFAGYLIRARVNDLILPELLFYYTQSSIYEEWEKQIFIQSTIQNIGADRYNQLPVVVPPKEEQEEILSYIRNKSSEIDKLVQDKERLIKNLESYKESLIFECVTGKKGV